MTRATDAPSQPRLRNKLTRRATADSLPKSRTAGDVARRASVARFRALVWKCWKENGRHDLPWRKIRDPYRILVSEMMLQQTQVPRVIGKYQEFLKAFPTPEALARVPLARVLKIWSGLGYNRRAKYLHDTAKKVVAEYGGSFKKALEHPLPGVGPYTKSAVKVFAFNKPDVLIETNIRTACIHHFFPHTKQVRDRGIIMYIQQAAEGQDPRQWHWALMDYGSYLKKNGVRNNSKSAHYTKQSKFEGSLRQVRGAILRELHAGRSPEKLLFAKKRLQTAFTSLRRDGLIVQEKGKWRIA